MKRILQEIAPTAQEPILNEKLRPLMRHYNTLRQLRGATLISPSLEGLSATDDLERKPSWQGTTPSKMTHVYQRSREKLAARIKQLAAPQNQAMCFDAARELDQVMAEFQVPVLPLDEEESNSPEPRQKNEDSDNEYGCPKINSATRKMRRFTDQFQSASL